MAASSELSQSAALNSGPAHDAVNRGRRPRLRQRRYIKATFACLHGKGRLVVYRNNLQVRRDTLFRQYPNTYKIVPRRCVTPSLSP